MTFARLLNRPLLLHRRSGGTVDEYGNATTTTAAAVATTGYIEQTQATEITVDQETYTSEWLAVLRPGTGLDASDRVEVPDLSATFEVIGTPARPRRLGATAEHHVEARLRQVTS